MNKFFTIKKTKTIILICIAVFVFLGVIFIGLKKWRLLESGKVLRSVMQGDYVFDARSPEEACSSLVPEIKSSNSGCELVASKRVDSLDIWKECVDGASVAGCFSCVFECE